MTPNLNNVLIGSDDPARLEAFYTSWLDEPAYRGGGWVGFRAGEGFLVVGPHTEVSGESPAFGRVMIGFQTEDVHGEFGRAVEAGAQVLRAPFHPVDDPDGWLAFLADPDGNSFQLMCPTGGDALEAPPRS